jgi:acyl carrier protein
MEPRIKAVMAQIFGIAAGEIQDDSSPDTIAKWDSVSHMNLVIALEAEFGVELSEEQISEMATYRLIVLTIRELVDERVKR